jgi:hypothetical protein
MKNFIPETVVSLESVAAVDAAVRSESNYNELKTFIVSFARLLSNDLGYEERHAALKAASKKKDSAAIYAIVIGIFLIIYSATSTFPLAKDYIRQEVIQVDATYMNMIGDRSKSTSSILGEHSVTLVTSEGNISLTTVPFSSDVFPTGEYAVTAWYAKNSKRLLFIEIHDIEA